LSKGGEEWLFNGRLRVPSFLNWEKEKIKSDTLRHNKVEGIGLLIIGFYYSD